VALVAILSLSGCEGEVSWAPLALDDGWPTSDPAAQGLDPDVLREMYEEAEDRPNLFSLLVVKNGMLVAEGYFNGHAADIATPTASATKSYTSALAGIALRDGVLASLDQEMMDFFPELSGEEYDARKDEITIGDLLRMRAGYPNDSGSPYLDSLHGSADWMPLLLEFPLEEDPGAGWAYSNLSAYAVGVILARAAETTLAAFANEHLFGPIGVTLVDWPRDARGYYYGSGDMAFTSRDFAKFGLLYLNHGVVDQEQIVPAEWVDASWEDSSVTDYESYGFYFRDVRYGYLWWHADVGGRDVHYAAGHGGQIIAIVPELDMIVVSTANSRDYGPLAWPRERAVFDLVGKLVSLQ